MAVHDTQHALPHRGDKGDFKALCCPIFDRLHAHNVPLLQWVLSRHRRRILVRWVALFVRVSTLADELSQALFCGMMSSGFTSNVLSMS